MGGIIVYNLFLKKEYRALIKKESKDVPAVAVKLPAFMLMLPNSTFMFSKEKNLKKIKFKNLIKIKKGLRIPLDKEVVFFLKKKKPNRNRGRLIKIILGVLFFKNDNPQKKL